MSVASHLNIPLDEYDARIRTFIPGYEQMLACAAQALRALDGPPPRVIDLGTGTGALAARCIQAVPGAQIVAVDEDSAILDIARLRICAYPGAVASFVHSNFLEYPLPPCDAVVASVALHHVRTTERKQQLYRDVRASLREGGLLISGDCFPSTDARLAALEREAWREHLRLSYSETETDGFFALWAAEDLYVPLELELALMRGAGFAAEVTWRLAPMAVVVARTV